MGPHITRFLNPHRLKHKLGGSEVRSFRIGSIHHEEAGEIQEGFPYGAVGMALLHPVVVGENFPKLEHVHICVF